jgi:hypothetical protein
VLDSYKPAAVNSIAMKALKFSALISAAAWCLVSCAHTPSSLGYHSIPVSWPPGSENVPDCTPLIARTGTSTDIKGVTVSTPVGVGVQGGEVKTEEKTLQAASDAAQQADDKFTRLCRMLPSYSHDQKAFYKTRDQMFELIAATTYVASAVATQTGQTPPQLTSVPTESSSAATAAGTNPAKAVANAPAPISSSPSTSAQVPKQKTEQSAKKQEQTLKNAIARLQHVTRKPVPKL